LTINFDWGDKEIMSCYPLILYLKKKFKTIITFKNVDLSTQTIYFRVKKERENTTAPLIEVALSNLTYTSPNTTGLLSVDLTASTLDEGNYYGEIEITDGTTYSDISPTFTVSIKKSIDN